VASVAQGAIGLAEESGGPDLITQERLEMMSTKELLKVVKKLEGRWQRSTTTWTSTWRRTPAKTAKITHAS